MVSDAPPPPPSPLAGLRGLMARPLTSYYLLLASSGLLLVLGLVMVFSATTVESYAATGNPYLSVTRQAIYALIGLAAFWFAHRLPLRTYKAIARPLVILSLALLVILDGVSALHSVKMIPHEKLGPIRVDSLWLYVGPIQVQPSELAKLALALWGAGVLVSLGPGQKRFADLARTLFPLSLVIFILVGLNDLGTMISMLILFAGLMFAAGVQTRVFAYLSGVAFVGVGGLILVHGYRSLRISGWIEPLSKCNVYQANNPCYQELEGRYAIANGGWFGVGLGQGHLKWGRLPNAHNDFIFAVIGEELGLVGCFIVLALLATLAYTGLRIARRVGDPFRRIVATGITAWLVGQATINIGGVIGLIPITGLPLPFISDGGSALVVVLGAVGVLASFARSEPDAARALHARPADRWVRIFWAPPPPLPRSESDATATVDEPDRGDDDPAAYGGREPRRRASATKRTEPASGREPVGTRRRW
ncbi:MAG TPA: putative peptidoglycan glycosyltransferase FtsW [Micromonosporaceae bacterium]